MAKEISIGDEVWVHGYVDEIRKDCIIIRNDGGYFGTVAEEIGYFDGYEDLADIPQTERQRLEGNRWTDTLTTEEKKCMLDALDIADTPQTDLKG